MKKLLALTLSLSVACAINPALAASHDKSKQTHSTKTKKVHHDRTYSNYFPANPYRDNRYHVTNLMDVFSQALVSDPTFQSQRAQLQASKENLPIAGALLGPQAFLTGQSEAAYTDQRSGASPAGGGSFGSLGPGTYKYAVNAYGFSVTQPIFDFANWAAFAQAKATVKQATEQFGADYQDLIIRVASAYFNVLLAKDDLNYLIDERKAVRRLYDQNLQRYRVGLGTITDVYNAKAQLDITISQEIAARNNLINQQEALRAITGHIYPALAGLRQNIPLVYPAPKNVETWVESSNNRNFTVRASQYAVQAAKQQVRVQFAGHLPTVDAIASIDESDAGNNGFGSTDETTGAVGLSLNFPLFQSGLVSSQTRQAQYQYQQSLSDLELSIRNEATLTRQDYNSVVSGISQVKADQQAIISNTSSLESTEAAFKVGTRTIVDVLTEQTNLTNAQTQYAQDVYTYLLDVLRLKEDAGSLSPKDLSAINRYLTKRIQLAGIPLTYKSNAPSIHSIRKPTLTPIQTTAPTSQQIKNLPVFTPQPNTQWTTPVTTSPSTTTPKTGADLELGATSNSQRAVSHGGANTPSSSTSTSNADSSVTPSTATGDKDNPADKDNTSSNSNVDLTPGATTNSTDAVTQGGANTPSSAVGNTEVKPLDHDVDLTPGAKTNSTDAVTQGGASAGTSDKKDWQSGSPAN